MVKVSVIIPVYNVEKYLRQCVESARNQSMQEIEILCINDGSTDGSGEILRQMAEEDSRIRVVDKANTGYGHTMNTGIDMAAGRYLVFLESDDFILPQMCQVFYELCEKHNLDMVKADFFEFKTKGEQICSRYRRVSNYKNYHEVITPGEHTEIFYESMYTWTCMYRREFINKYGIRHHETPGASYQDNGFWFQTMMYGTRVYLLEQAFYMYRQDNPESSIHSRGKVHAFSDEYAFIREKIETYPGKADRQVFREICAFFNVHHNMNSLTRVDKKYTEELLGLIMAELELYIHMGAWRVRKLGRGFWQRLLPCLFQPEEVKQSLWRYIDRDAERKNLLESYSAYILYGAGKYAHRVLEVLEQCKLWNKDILCGVTDIKIAPEEIEGIKVRNIEELWAGRKEALTIVCAKRDTEAYAQMWDNLQKQGISHIAAADELFVEDWWQL